MAKPPRTWLIRAEKNATFIDDQALTCPVTASPYDVNRFITDIAWVSLATGWLGA